ncbi:hypothetical protein [Pyxidicoccus caerfyrddinensis]|uniref:hypothetical protein n=1 Tax=Pyxidicoccus caerfyrddinensis TaxID=2709663 RepID=UPI0013DB6355|nr:hypothetical protein [Pyxidicoccus caerfyrddinensis]
MKCRWAGLLVLLSACANTSYRYQGRDTYFGGEGKAVWVRGPWPAIQPATDVDDVIDQLCPAIVELEGPPLLSNRHHRTGEQEAWHRH